MKATISVFGFVCAFALVMTTAAPARADRYRVETLQPALVDVVPSRVFAPLGFDDNDNVQVVLDGVLGDTCYKLGPVTKEVDHDKKKIVIRQQAYYYTGGWCAEVEIPYVQTVDVGMLQAGQYEVIVKHENTYSEPKASVPVALSTTQSPDDFLYAPVSDARLEKVATPGGVHGTDQTSAYQLVLAGEFSNSCMRLKDTRVMVRPNGVIEVLPIVELDRTGICSQVKHEFSVAVSLKDAPHGRYLIHVRSLNGQSLNKVADL